MQEPTSRFGCFALDCVACHGDSEWRVMRYKEQIREIEEEINELEEEIRDLQDHIDAEQEPPA